jgi:hypothetical protein
MGKRLTEAAEHDSLQVRKLFRLFNEMTEGVHIHEIITLIPGMANTGAAVQVAV